MMSVLALYWPVAVLFVAIVAALIIAGMLTYGAGLRRGQALARLELPAKGAIYPNDGRIAPIYADNGADAIELVARITNHAGWIH